MAALEDISLSLEGVWQQATTGLSVSLDEPYYSVVLWFHYFDDYITLALREIINENDTLWNEI